MILLIRNIVLFCILVFSFSVQADDDDTKEEKRKLVDELLMITGAKQKLPQLLSTTLTREIASKLAQEHGQLDRTIVKIIHQEAGTIIYEDFILNNKLMDIFYGLYDKYFSLQDIRNLVNFYSTPTGKRSLQVMPQITRSSMQEAKSHAATLTDKINDRIYAKLEKLRQAVEEAEKKKSEATETPDSEATAAD